MNILTCCEQFLKGILTIAPVVMVSLVMLIVVGIWGHFEQNNSKDLIVHVEELQKDAIKRQAKIDRCSVSSQIHGLQVNNRESRCLEQG